MRTLAATGRPVSAQMQHRILPVDGDRMRRKSVVHCVASVRDYSVAVAGISGVGGRGGVRGWAALGPLWGGSVVFGDARRDQ